MDRADVLARCAMVLKSADGQILMRELEAVWNPATTTIDEKLQNFWLTSLIKMKCTDSMAIIIKKS